MIAEPYSSADFQHGPMALLERGFPVLAAAPGGAVFDDTLALLRRLVRERLIELLVLSDRDEALRSRTRPCACRPASPEWLTPDRHGRGRPAVLPTTSPAPRASTPRRRAGCAR